MFYGCSESGDGQVQIHWNGDQMLYADFKNGKAVWTAPLLEELEDVLSPRFYILALVSRERLHKYYLAKAMKIEKSPTEEKAPTILIYPWEEEEPGEENTLYCYISRFYPPDISVVWTRNGVQVTEGVALSNLIPESDGTFSQLASLSVRPETGDVHGCSVQHQALSRPANSTWALPVRPAASAAAWLCLSLGLVCFIAGVFLLVLSAQPSLRKQLLDCWRAAYQRVALGDS
ncbi:H-2 class II histocompatibility antigen, I-E alpha chain-like [Centropristis striata]|uniref:H-2 class II histocompatibility antigen, I-E alpha chain-like n=1 Tax=Centropristis striata TaxID=184440 RepID=UPI0027DF9CE5|nr:H-2 class II histocompatibility antigen, I-E alpha chain-like [Centropristis striata]